jgi:hypothetical protein
MQLNIKRQQTQDVIGMNAREAFSCSSGLNVNRADKQPELMT